ncbi:uncharacterized protein LOC136040005 [Artemia franciscana]
MPHPISRQRIRFEDLCPYNQKRIKEDKIPGTSTNELLASFGYKKEITLHHTYLKFMLNHHFRLDQIHSVIQFKQEFLMKTYIDHFMERRSQTKSKTKSELYKLFNNTIFGKSVEQVRKRTSCIFTTDLKTTRRLVGDCNISSFSIVNENLALIFRKKRHVLLNKNIAAGAAILSISKKIMAETFWDNLVPYYGGPLSGRIYLAYSDTDSVLIKIFTKDLVGNLTSPTLRPIIDFSNWDPIKYPHLVNSPKKNEFGRLKNEIGSDTFIELIAASPKCYCVVTQNEKLKKAAKGTSKHLMKKYLTAERFKEALFEGRVIRTTTNAIRSLKLKLYTMEVVRTAISGVSDKLV